MAWYPGANHWPLNAETQDRSHTPVRMTLHTAVSGATNLYRYGPYRGTYSTFYVNGTGDVYQYASTSQATRGRKGEKMDNAHQRINLLTCQLVNLSTY